MPDDIVQTLQGELAVTIAPLIAGKGGEAIKAAIECVADLRVRFAQIGVTSAGLRPRDLDRSARRDLLAALRRRELEPSGLDAWIPPAHFDDAALVDRAANAMEEIIALAGDLGRVPVSLHMPPHDEIASRLIERAQRLGVPLADHAIPATGREGCGTGVDPAAHLSQDLDPIAAVHAAGARLAAARLVDLSRSGMRSAVGSGRENRLDVRAYKVALSVNGYRRPVVIDARQWGDPLRGIKQTIAEWTLI